MPCQCVLISSPALSGADTRDGSPDQVLGGKVLGCSSQLESTPNGAGGEGGFPDGAERSQVFGSALVSEIL